jgi:peptidyl-prolyl cis-trans isomerase A (cyclophilin A)
VLIGTEYGSILVELYPVRAPVTVENFLRYVDEGRFDGATFYRTVTMRNQPDNDVKIEVIQGGLGWKESDLRLAPIRHETTAETGIRHENGTISMARAEPGTADSEFFICVGDQPELDYGGRRNPDGKGFAAFGKVLDGMDVVMRIHESPEKDQLLEEPVRITDVNRVRRGPPRGEGPPDRPAESGYRTGS